jgi:hypothetical protein
MSIPSWLESDGDLLRQRRLERGLAAAAEPLVPARGLLLRGAALGGRVRRLAHGATAFRRPGRRPVS